jgi:drug/metabolite transporter (DMT)-like permease
MGRRSRKRPGREALAPPPPPPPPAEAPRPPRALTRRARLNEAPRPPWHPVPLSELCILAGLVCLVVAFVGGGGSRRGVLLVFGLVLVAVAALEVALREHLAGYRSHSALLALAGAMAVVVPAATATHLSHALAGALIAALFAAGFLALRALFRRRSGGFGFRA